MRRSIAVSWVGGLLLSLSATPVAAQMAVQGAVIVQSGPVAAEVEVRRARRVIAEREVIVVERIHRGRGWWKKHPYRVVTVYYDGSRFYRRPFKRPHLRRVVVYEWAGRYYIDEDHWKQNQDFRRQDDDRDRHDHD
jgi:hypothetical protein